jgi:putative endonuclease
MGLIATLRRRKTNTEKQRCGDIGEDLALAYLQQHRLTLVERNFLCKGGEIDLVMRSGAMLVFIEVRQRAPGRHGGAADSVTRTKQKRLIVAAQIYLQRFRHPPPCRFDVVAIDGAVITWLQNAIDA